MSPDPVRAEPPSVRAEPVEAPLWHFDKLSANRVGFIARPLRSG
jgi:hypothetical protein